MKVGIITGASSGLGREFALMANKYYKDVEELWLIARRSDRLEELQKHITIPIRVIQLDLLKEESIYKLKDMLKELKPNVRLLVNAAGYGKIGKVCSVNLEEETGMVRLNCEGLIAVTHVVLPYIRKGGKIIQFASAAAFMPQPNFSIYAASKAFVLSYSRGLQEELRSRDITVTAVCPGPVRTEFFQVANTGVKIAMMKSLAMADAKDVVRLSIKDNLNGKTVSTYGMLMKSLYVITKVLPHSLILKGMRLIK